MYIYRATQDAQTCDYCKRQHGRDATQQLPHSVCTNSNGCRCVAVNVTELSEHRAS